MLSQSFEVNFFNRKRCAGFMIILGVILIASGMTIFLLKTDTSPESEVYENQKQIEEGSQTSDEIKTEDTSPSVEPSEPVSENQLIVSEPDYFSGIYSGPEGFTFLMADETAQETGDVPAFHFVSAISAEAGVNPKTIEASDNLFVIMSAVPDREMSVSVLVSFDAPIISGTTPDMIQGLQWILTYSGGEFKKTARLVTSESDITPLDAENFNVRFVGNESTAEVEFFGPPGTLYYAVMICDDVYFTLILP